MYNRASVYVQGTAVEVVDALSKARYDGAPCEDHLLAALRDAKDDQKPCRFLVWLGKGHHVPVTDEVRAARPSLVAGHGNVRSLARSPAGGALARAAMKRSHASWSVATAASHTSPRWGFSWRTMTWAGVDPGDSGYLD